MNKLNLLAFVDQIIKRFWRLKTIFLLLTILFLSLYPLPQLSIMKEGADKFYHFIAYLLFAVPLGYAQPKYSLLYILVMIALSGTIELIQPYVNRHGEWLDFLANTLGIFVGFFFGRVVAKFIKNIIVAS